LSAAILSTSYLPPIQYISKFLLYEKIVIEKFENYQKQSYRNRCYIYGANGRQCLVIPVKKVHDSPMPITGVEIDYTYSWQRIHLKSIESAYRLSPFYEYYADELIALYKIETPLLPDWNMMLLETVLTLLGIGLKPEESKSWEFLPAGCADFRKSIHPKERLMLPDRQFDPVSYPQVFRERYGFIPNLSIIDLLFNEGPESVSVLRRSVRSEKAPESSP